MLQVASPLTSRFMELESDMSIKSKAEVIIEYVQRKLEKGITFMRLIYKQTPFPYVFSIFMSKWISLFT